MAKPRILIIDTYYPEFLNFWPLNRQGTYSGELARLLAFGFATADFYSSHLRSYGWEVMDVVANYDPLQDMWAKEHGFRVPPFDVIHKQIELFKPDVIFCQALGVLGPRLRQYFESHIVAGQCSCAVRKELIPYYHRIFTSFPHYVSMFNSLGSEGLYNPLAFEPSVLLGIPKRPRDLDIVFVGGVSETTHWHQGFKLLTAIAESFPDRAHFYGYGYDNLPPTHPIRKVYRGPAWGLDMYALYSRAKIVINRHGEISQGYSNNMRMYEATGCGALLMTEDSLNLKDLFITSGPDCEVGVYHSIDDAIKCIQFYLDNTTERIFVAANGRARTLVSHTYAHRMKTVSDGLLELL